MFLKHWTTQAQDQAVSTFPWASHIRIFRHQILISQVGSDIKTDRAGQSHGPSLLWLSSYVTSENFFSWNLIGGFYRTILHPPPPHSKLKFCNHYFINYRIFSEKNWRLQGARVRPGKLRFWNTPYRMLWWPTNIRSVPHISYIFLTSRETSEQLVCSATWFWSEGREKDILLSLLPNIWGLFLVSTMVFRNHPECPPRQERGELD